MSDTPLKFCQKHNTLKFWLFQIRGSGFKLPHHEQELILEKIYIGFIEFCNIYLEFNQCDEQNPKIILKTEEIKFSAKFAQEMKFHENWGNFELKIRIGADKKIIGGVKNLILDLRIWPSSILVDQESPQTEQNWIQIKPRPKTHLPARLGNLVHL